MTRPVAAPPQRPASPGHPQRPAGRGRALAVRCDNLVHVYGTPGSEVAALRGVDLTVRPGEMVALLGPSGAGKTTLLWHLAGLLRPTAGRVEVNGRRLTELGAGALARFRLDEVGLLLQNPARNLLPYQSAQGNLLFAQAPARRSAAARRRRAAELLDRVGLAGAAHRRAGRLSGGEQQRLALAVALANEPGLLLADEPTTQLDPVSAAAVIELIRDANASLGTTVVAVTHDPAVAAALGRTITIRDGRVGAEGLAGQEYVVVGRDGTLQLPADLTDLFPPGSLARAERHEHGVFLHQVDPARDPAAPEPAVTWSLPGPRAAATDPGARRLLARGRPGERARGPGPGLRDRRPGCILADFDLTVGPGERLAVVGPSGSGKTSLLALLAGLAAPAAGQVLLDGVPVVPGQVPPGVATVLQGHGLVSCSPRRRTSRSPCSPAGMPPAGPRRRPRRRWPRWAWPSTPGSSPTSCPAASSSGWRWHGPWPPGPPCSSPTSRPPSRTVPHGSWSSAGCWASRRPARSLVLATHDPEVAQRCDRVVDLADLRPDPARALRPGHWMTI